MSIPDSVRSSSDSTAPAWMRLLLTANVAALLAIALFFRVWKLGSVPGLNGDEAWFGIAVLRFLHGEPVSWLTPSHNPLSPFWCLPLLALHAAFEPSFALLRVVSVVSGCLALVVNWWLCRRTFDAAAAWISTLLLAVLPINIAYSRFATDPSQSLLATLPLVYLPLLAIREPARSGRFFALALLALCAAFWVHPTNAFCAVFLVIAALYRWKDRWLPRRRAESTTVRGVFVYPALAVVLALMVWLLWTQSSLQETFAVRRLFLFARDFSRLFSGVTIYRYIPGSCRFGFPAGNPAAPLGARPPEPSMRDIIWPDFVCFACWAIVKLALLRRVWLNRKLEDAPQNRLDEVLLLMTAGAVLPFYWSLGYESLQPGYERYALWLLAPCALIFTRGFQALLDSAEASHRLWKHAILTAGVGVLWLLLGSFDIAYVRYFQRTGGTAAFAFRTAAEEPKLSVLRQISEWRDINTPRQPVWIIASTWWNYQPLLYLSLTRPDVRVVSQFEAERRLQTGVAPPDYADALRTGRVWFVGFEGSAEASQFVRKLKAHRVRFEKYLSHDSGGKPLMRVLHLSPRSGTALHPSALIPHPFLKAPSRDENKPLPEISSGRKRIPA